MYLACAMDSRRTAQERCTKCGSRGARSGMHAALLGQVIPLPRVAGAAGGHHVGPLVVAAARERDQVIPRQALAVAQLELAPVAVLAAVAVAGEEECVGDLATEAAGDVHELDQADDRWFGQCEAFASDDVARVRLDDLGLALDDQAQGPPDRDHRQRLERGVQRQAPHATSPQRNEVEDATNPGSLDSLQGPGPTGLASRRPSGGGGKVTHLLAQTRPEVAAGGRYFLTSAWIRWAMASRSRWLRVITSTVSSPGDGADDLGPARLVERLGDRAGGAARRLEHQQRARPRPRSPAAPAAPAPDRAAPRPGGGGCRRRPPCGSASLARPSSRMSRESVAWVTTKPSVARASRSSSWLSMRRSRTTRRIAAWRWIFMRTGSARYTSRPPTKVASTSSRAAREHLSPPGPPAGDRAGRRMTTQSPHFPGARLPISRSRPSARAPSRVQRASARVGVETGQRARRARLGQQVERRRRSRRNRFRVPPGVPRAKQRAERRVAVAVRAVGAAGSAPPRRRAGPAARRSASSRLDHVDAERALRQHPVLARAMPPASAPSGAGSGMPRSRHASANGPAPPRSSCDLRRRLGQMHRERQALRPGPGRGRRRRAARSRCTGAWGETPIRTRPPANRPSSLHPSPGAARATPVAWIGCGPKTSWYAMPDPPARRAPG